MFNLGKSESGDCLTAFRRTEGFFKKFPWDNVRYNRLKLQQGRSWLDVKSLF